MESVANNIIDEVKIPFTPVYLIRPGMFSQVPEDVVLCILLNDETIDDFKSCFPKLRLANYKFMISFGTRKRFEEGMRLLIQSMFCLNYHSEGGEPVLAVTASPDLLPEISRRLSSQGYHAVIIWSSFETGKKNGDHAERIQFPANQNPSQWFENAVASDYRLLTGYIIIEASDTAGCSYIDYALRNTWTRISNDGKLYSETITAYTQARNDRSALTVENNKLKRQLKGTETTIGVIRTKYKDDYENLFAWYHHEYEILPLWYKRFGHILKVIMGKRTFRSLFSDEVKKYKN